MTLPTSQQEILLVEDDEFLQASLERLLTMSGYAVRVYSTAEEFLKDLSERPSPEMTQCILMDVNLQGMDGVQAQQRIREAACDTPVVFMSGQLDAHKVNQAWRDGAHCFLFKPFKPQELLKVLDEALSQARQMKRNLSHQEDARLREQLNMLTQRQREILKFVAVGQSNTAISAQMNITARTVKMHRAGIMHRLGFGHLADLVRFYERCQHLL